MKKTKIICTMGPNTNDAGLMRALVQNGMDIARFNFSHGDHEGAESPDGYAKEDPGGRKQAGGDSSGYQGAGDPYRDIKRWEEDQPAGRQPLYIDDRGIL